MNRLLNQLLGVLILGVGIWFLGKDIIITTYSSPYWWRSIPASMSILAIMGGVMSLVFLGRSFRRVGGFLLILGVVLVFLSGGLVLKSVTMWNFIIAFVAMAVGYQLMTQGRLRF